jgi:hypothetical protein
VGTWSLNDNRHLKELSELSAAERSRFEAKTTALISLVHSSKTFSQPMGFDAQAFPRYWTPAECEDEAHPCVGHPVAFQMLVYLYAYVLFDEGRVGHSGEPDASAMITVNELTRALGANPFGSNANRVLPDGRKILYMPREIPLRVGGYQVYEKPLGQFKHFFLTKRDRLPWVPVTREQFLTALIRERENNFAKQHKDREPCDQSYKEWMADGDRRRRGFENMYQEWKKSDPADAERRRADNEKMEANMPGVLQAAAASCEASLKKAAAMEAEQTEALRAELARLTPPERASQAWYAPGPGPGKSGLVTPTDPQAGALVALNPDFFDRSRPRTDFQIICVEVSSEPEFQLNKDEVPFWRLEEFLTTTDWQRVAELLD